MLQIISTLCVLSSVAGYFLLCIETFLVSVWSLLKILLIMGVPYILVSAARHFINAKRPYELYDFYEKKPKDKSGQSFPSRHAYSSFVISASLCFIHPFLGGVLVFLGVLLCFCRVLLGIHFIRDVVCGAILGIFSSVFGVLIFSPF